MAESSSAKQHVLFIRGGGGDEAQQADGKLVASLQQRLGAAYQVHYPQMPGDDSTDMEWTRYIGREVDAIGGQLILVAHSVGASALLKYLAENRVNHPLRGIFLLATPFWGGDQGWHYEGFTIADDFPTKLPSDVPIFLYHNRNDPEVPFAHLALYTAKLPHAVIREGAGGGHQFDNDLTHVAHDIQNLNL